MGVDCDYNLDTVSQNVQFHSPEGRSEVEICNTSQNIHRAAWTFPRAIGFAARAGTHSHTSGSGLAPP